jgi:hypothetical protein
LSCRKLAAWGVVALILSQWMVIGSAHAAGYDSSYEVYRGDFNGDGRGDLYVASTRGPIVIPVDDLPIVIPQPVKNVVLQSNADGTFTMISSFTPAQKSALASWPRASVEVALRDIDQDGAGDIQLSQLGSVVPGAMAQILLAERRGNAAPKKLIARTGKFNAFHNDLISVMRDHNFFESNAPLRVKSTPEPISRQYYGSIIRAGSSVSTLFVVSRCTLAYPGGRCYLTPVPPSQCQQTGSQFNDRNEYIGEGTRNVCSDYVHVFVYVPNSVQLERDYTVFDPDAREAWDIIESLLDGCLIWTPGNQLARLNDIATTIFGTPIGQLQVLDNWMHGLTHPPAPGDNLFDTSDPTFHHYDVKTDICTTDQVNCNVTGVDALAWFYSHPSFRIEPLKAQPDTGLQKMAYIPWWPGNVDDPTAYTKELGPITQRLAQTGHWAGAIQNITTPQHYMYPGTITRKIFQEGNQIRVRTHGIGVNRSLCLAPPPGSFADPAVQAMRLFMAGMNAAYGDDAFRTVDRVLVKRWRTDNGYPTSVQMTAEPSAAAVSVRAQ